MQARDELTERLVAWARNLKFREATKKEGAVPAETLCTAARADLGLVGNDLDGFEYVYGPWILCGVVVRPKRESCQASVWGVTSDTYQASSLVMLDGHRRDGQSCSATKRRGARSNLKY